MQYSFNIRFVFIWLDNEGKEELLRHIRYLYKRENEEEDQLPKKNVWLFNIHEDPNEHYDLSDKHPDIVKKLLDKLSRYQATAIPVRYPLFDPKANPALHGHAWVPWTD